jgi:hypothetical protein
MENRMKDIKILIKSKHWGIKEIEDLYFFEEEGLHWFDGDGHYEKFLI